MGRARMLRRPAGRQAWAARGVGLDMWVSGYESLPAWMPGAWARTLDHPMAGKPVEVGVLFRLVSGHATVRIWSRSAQVPSALASVLNTPGDMPAKFDGVTACAE